MKKIHSIKEFVSYCVVYHFFWIILSFIALVPLNLIIIIV